MSELAVILILLVFNGIFAMAEIALVSSRKARLQERAEGGDSGAKLALRLMESPGKFLSTVQIGITLVGVLAGAFGGLCPTSGFGSAWFGTVCGSNRFRHRGGWHYLPLIDHWRVGPQKLSHSESGGHRLLHGKAHGLALSRRLSSCLGVGGQHPTFDALIWQRSAANGTDPE